jgi:hypothetical protein
MRPVLGLSIRVGSVGLTCRYFGVNSGTDLGKCPVSRWYCWIAFTTGVTFVFNSLPFGSSPIGQGAHAESNAAADKNTNLTSLRPNTDVQPRPCRAKRGKDVGWNAWLGGADLRSKPIA